MFNFLVGLIAGGCFGLVLAAFLGAAGRASQDEERRYAYRAGYAACLAKFRRCAPPNFRPPHLAVVPDREAP